MRLSDHVHSDIFALYPGYCWGKVLCWGIDNTGSPEPAASLLRAAEARVRLDESLREVTAHPRIAAWREAFARFGARPSKYQSSIEALVRRARRGDELPPINLLVGLYNAVSLMYLLPVGGDDLERVEGGLQLRPATGREVYHELGSGTLDPPEAGEIIYADDAKVLCRRWCWRQGDQSKITPASRRVVLNVHGLPPATRAEVEAAVQELCELVRRHCGGQALWYVLDREHPHRESVID